MADVLKDVLWTEKYRPRELGQLALESDTRSTLEAYLAAGEIPHLLLVGPPGSGKTTVARILTAGLDCQVLALNASAERGIDVVRNKIGSFVVSLLSAKWNVVFLDEADEMTPDAQTALRNMIENYADRSRFILTGNKAHKIIGAIQSRCQLLTLGRPPFQERFRVLTRVLEEEGVTAAPTVVAAYAEKYPDMRRMLMAAQKAWLSSRERHPEECEGAAGGPCSCGPDKRSVCSHRGALLPPSVTKEASGAEMYQMLLNKNWSGLRKLCASGEMDHQHALRELFYSVPDDHPKAGFLRHVLGKGVHESGYTPDPVVLFLGVCAEAMEGI